MIEIRKAVPGDLESVSSLFGAYRQFYGQAAEIDLAKRFLLERLTRADSVILVAAEADLIAGFTQLYPSFSSTRVASIFILNDLYVSPSHRRKGVGRALLEAAARYAKDAGAVRMNLSTAHTNVEAQRLYESLGWKQDELFRTYTIATGV